MSKQPNKYHFILISVFLIAAIIAIYWQVYSYDFVKYDDDYYVTNNDNIKSGFDWKNIRWAFTANYSHNWHPVTWISHMIDYQLFKNWAGGYHLTNVLFHIVNTILLFYILMRMTGAVWPSAFVAAAFALHPLHVESVAWIAERKDVLSTFFWLLTMWAYVRYVENPKLKWYLAAIVLFMLGLMSKPMLVTLPFVLLLLDYWPLQRKFSKWLVIEKIPFFICSFVSCVITYLVQRNTGAMAAVEIFKPAIRINNAIVAYVMYIAKMFWPSRLVVLYPHPGDSLSATKVIICALLLVLISICFIYLGRRRRFFTVGWLWYLVTLVPVIGLVQVGAQAMADRYTYMTLTGLFIIIAFGAKEFIPKLRYRNFTLTILTVAALAGLAFTSRQQLNYWKNSLTLFRHTLEVTPNNPLILESYANYLFEKGRLNESIEQFDKLMKIKPDSAESHCNFGCALMWTGKPDLAIEQFKLAIKYKPGDALGYNNLAAVLYEQGRGKEAVDYFKQALKLKPDFTGARFMLGVTLSSLQRFDEAIESFNQVLKLEPKNLSVYENLGRAYESLGRADEAIKSYRKGLQIDPNNTNLRQLLDAVLKKQEPAAGK
jgi:Flp pilus assembly protein TadD